jgi:hypothetical protein
MTTCESPLGPCFVSVRLAFYSYRSPRRVARRGFTVRKGVSAIARPNWGPNVAGRIDIGPVAQKGCSEGPTRRCLGWQAYGYNCAGEPSGGAPGKCRYLAISTATNRRAAGLHSDQARPRGYILTAFLPTLHFACGEGRSCRARPRYPTTSKEGRWGEPR